MVSNVVFSTNPFRYAYDSFTMVSPDGEAGFLWRITHARPYLVVSNQFVVQRDVLHNVQKRLVLQKLGTHEGVLCLPFFSRS